MAPSRAKLDVVENVIYVKPEEAIFVKSSKCLGMIFMVVLPVML